MKITVKYNRKNYQCDLNKPIDISIPLESDAKGPRCFYAPKFKVRPFKSGDFIGSVASGAPVNFHNVSFNPHGNGTHTESVGHISPEIKSINETLKTFHFIARLISLTPKQKRNGDFVITKKMLESSIKGKIPSALVIRTLPNDLDKKQKDYSGKNPCYIEPSAMRWIVAKKVQHLLIDLPSVDREEDEGKLAGHRIFWSYPKQERAHCTITEMIYVDNKTEDGLYFLNIQIPSFELDAAPSKPVLYPLKEI